MATIITVHGTNATGPEEGEKWWQRGSGFEASLRRLLVTKLSDITALTWSPFIWDGANSERSRRAAALRLFQKMLELEAKGEPYCVIGHSHGGSVCNLAMVAAANQDTNLANLGKIITVGTPFLRFQFPRLFGINFGLLGYPAITGFLVGLLILIWFTVGGHSVYSWVSIIFAVLFLLTSFVASRQINDAWWHEGLAGTITSIDRLLSQKGFAPSVEKWVGLWHPDDEAINSLKWASNAQPVTIKAPLSARALGLILIASMGASAFLADWVIHKGAELYQGVDAQSDLVAGGVQLLLYSVCLLVLIAITRQFNDWSGRQATRLINDQLRGAVYGGQSFGELAIGAEVYPLHFFVSYPPLPQGLADRITALSDTAAAKALPQVRRALTMLADSSIIDSPIERLLKNLSWDELIHTAYFSEPSFQKLLAYLISQTPRFQPSHALLNDSEYALIRKWSEELKAFAITKENA